MKNLKIINANSSYYPRDSDNDDNNKSNPGSSRINPAVYLRYPYDRDEEWMWSKDHPYVNYPPENEDRLGVLTIP